MNKLLKIIFFPAVWIVYWIDDAVKRDLANRFESFKW